MSAPSLLTHDDCASITARVLELAPSRAAQVAVTSIGRSTTQFARGEMRLGSEVLGVWAELFLEIAGRHGTAQTNQLDDAGLRQLVREAETMARQDPTPEEWEWGMRLPETLPTGPQIYFDTTTAAMAPDSQSDIAHRAMGAADGAKLLAAGDIQIESTIRAVRSADGFFGYERSNYGEVSVTARGQDRSASGWAWSGFEDWSRVDVAGTIARAVDLATRSADPVAIEPGRYTVILEPAAVAEFLHAAIGVYTAYWGAGEADATMTVYGKLPRGTNKIGLQMMDRRLGMTSDPWDPDRPATVLDDAWRPLTPVRWFDKGVLQQLAYSDEYAAFRGRAPLSNPGGVRLTTDGPPTSLDDMLASVKRGVWVSRLSNIGLMNGPTLLLTGTTRDGTFLIENGKVTKPIKNFRFTESPFFVFNQLEAWGKAERASRLTVAPRLLLRDFNFTSLTDAI